MAVTLISATPAQAARFKPTAPQATASVPGVGVPVVPKGLDPASAKALRSPQPGQPFGGDWSSRLRASVKKQDRRGGFTETADGSAQATAVAGPSGPNGTFEATKLTESGTWSAGGSAGDFTWSYPLRVPPAVGGVGPTIALSYSSASVDGRTAATNNQPSWIGEGFDFWPGYVERGYKACADDQTGGNNAEKTGDRCWGTDNATISLNGTTAELVLDDATKVWRARSDSGWRIQRVNDTDNGDNDRESWTITTTDGTQYQFGVDSTSTWTVPVFGNHAGEPCHGANFDSSWCQQAYRWNLSRVVDVHGNVTAYSYETEVNHYARNLDPAKATPYVRGGYLTRIDYGAARVVFENGERCINLSGCDRNQPATYPDTPLDQKCDGGTCPDKWSPTFWTTKRLAKVRTQIASGSGFTDVESWTLRHTFPSPGDGTRAGMWLAGITHDGLPEVTFEGIQLSNRVMANTDTQAPMLWFRIQKINTEFGGVTSVEYEQPECSRTTPVVMPQGPEGNTMRCFPAVIPKPGKPDETTLDWFHKYVVKQVTMIDRVGGSPSVTTAYQYEGGGAWHYDDLDGLTDAKYKTWSGWRGYAKVRVLKGNPGQAQTRADTLYYRGMNGTFSDSEGTAVTDAEEFAGMPREQLTYLGKDGPVLSATVTEPWRSNPTATRVSSWGTVHARHTGTGKTRTRTAISGGNWRQTSVTNQFDAFGMVIAAEDSAQAAGDQCTRTTYSRNDSTWIVVPVQTETVSVSCSATPQRPQHVISDVRRPYNDKGDVVASETLTESGYIVDSRTSYDSHGRVTESFDALGNKTSTVYTPASGGPVTGTKVTNPLGHVTTTTYNPAFGAQLTITDPNGRVVEMAYDGLGRLVQGWSADRPRSGGYAPSVEFGYQVRADNPVVVTTKSLKANGNYLTAYALYDGLMRPRQVQVPAAGGGRVITDTFHDALGQAYKTNGNYFNSAAPGNSILAVADNAVPNQTVTIFDGAGRQIESRFLSGGVERWHTSTVHMGDKVQVTPPAGETATVTVTDARGRTTELHQLPGSAGPALITRYAYDNAGHLSSVTEPSGLAWHYTYDMRGRKVRDEDPDKGVTTTAYDAMGNTVSDTDVAGTVTYTYDALGRKTGTYDGSVKLSGYSYDTAIGGKGHLAGSFRYANNGTYSSKVVEYDAAYRPLSRRISIPTGEGSLAGLYDYQYTYHVDGSQASVAFPAAGDLGVETVRGSYDSQGLPSTLYSALGYYVSRTQYTPFSELAQLRLSTLADNQGGNVVWRTFGYADDTRRLQRVIAERSTAPNTLSDVGYEYDPGGNITRIADQQDVQCFRQDFLRRLTEAWTPASGDCQATPSGQLGGPAPYWTSWTYDTAGNRVGQVKHNANGDASTSYTYAGHRLTQAGSKAYTHDGTGNMTSRGGQTLTWTKEGHLGEVAEAGKSTSFVYDADGNRLLRKDPTGTTLYLDGQEIRLDKASGALTGTRFYTLGGQTVAMRTKTTLTWLAADHQGTSELAVNASTMEPVARRQMPFGENRNTTGTFPGERGFVGGTIDPSTGLTHLGARDYDAELGRFISVDPVMDLMDPQQMHGYVYANNSPVSASDPDGRWPKWVKSAASAVTNTVKNVATNVSSVAKDFTGNIVSAVYNNAGLISAVTGVLALIPTPLSPAFAAISIATGAIDTYKSCREGQAIDCGFGVAGLVPGAGVVVRGFRNVKKAENALERADEADAAYKAGYRSHKEGVRLERQVVKAEKNLAEARKARRPAGMWKGMRHDESDLAILGDLALSENIAWEANKLTVSPDQYDKTSRQKSAGHKIYAI